jgi:[acyl-carrier-protein] S-malonyltransferase
VGKTAIIFPGQGAQFVGMVKDIAGAFDAARQTFDEANRLLGFDLATICFEGPAERLDATDISQPAIFTASVAVWRAMQSTGIADELRPQATAGLSLGEYTALWLAGSLSFADGLRLVHQRGQFMQEAAMSTPGGMVSVMGLSEDQITNLCLAAAGGEVLSPANFNCPGQIVISGGKGACERALALSDGRGGRALPLRVAGAFHSALMEPAATRLRGVLVHTPITPPRIPVVSNVSADYHRSPDSIRELLQTQVARPIRWQQSIERLLADGFDRFAEVGPGRVLSGLMRKINRSATALNYSTLESFGGARVTR